MGGRRSFMPFAASQLIYARFSDRFAGFLILTSRGHAMDAIERIKSQLQDNPVMLYMKGTPDFPQCGFSARAVQILQHCEAEFGYVNVFADVEIRENLKAYSNWPTYPQLFVNAELVGGSDIMMEMFQNGELQPLLAAAKPTALA
jgi:monothiol glutaredoxin